MHNLVVIADLLTPMNHVCSQLTHLVPLDLIPLDGLPDSEPKALPGKLGSKMNDVVGVVKMVGYIICIIALIVAAVGMAVAGRRGDGSDHAGSIGKVIASAMLISAASGLIAFFV